MALKIRMRKMGRTNRPFYRLILTDSRNPRDGKYKESLGWYNPFQEEGGLVVKGERVEYWLSKGAELSEKAAHLVKKGAPAVMEALQKQAMSKRAKVCAKKRGSRKKALATA